MHTMKRPGGFVHSGLWWHACTCALLLTTPVFSGRVLAQTPTRLAILQAAERGAASPAELRALRAGARSANGDVARLAIRTLGRLERVALVPDILPGLRHALPEVRTEAANALAQAAQGFTRGGAPPVATVQSVQASLIDRLGVEAEASVRATLREAIARLPYRVAADVDRGERAILEVRRDPALVDDRLGVARALEALCRLHGAIRPPTPTTIDQLVALVEPDRTRPERERLRDARIRRLALEALIVANAVSDRVLTATYNDADAQVRRLAVTAAATSADGRDVVARGFSDPSPLVRLEAVRVVAASSSAERCTHLLAAAGDADLTVGLAAIDRLDSCAALPEAMEYLSIAVADRSELNAPRGWHRNVHALLALAAAAPDRLADQVTQYAQSRVWQVRRAVATIAAARVDRPLLVSLAQDPEDRVAIVARRALGQVIPSDPPPSPERLEVTARELSRLASPRARVTVKDVGRFELALVASEAPLTVIRFARLAEAGYYDGTTFDQPDANGALRAGFRGHEAESFAVSEVGLWPHVRGTVGLAAPVTGDAQFFINLVDNPRLDHQSTVFAQILTGQEVVDRILEGDIIESIEIIP